MKILLTGSSGFIGRQFIKFAQDIELIPFDLFLGNDIMDYYKLLTMAQRVDAVVHLAGATGVPFSNDNPYYYYRYNVEGTMNIARVCSNLKIPLIYASTGDVKMLNSHYSGAMTRQYRTVREAVCI